MADDEEDEEKGSRMIRIKIKFFPFSIRERNPEKKNKNEKEKWENAQNATQYLYENLGFSSFVTRFSSRWIINMNGHDFIAYIYSFFNVVTTFSKEVSTKENDNQLDWKKNPWFYWL